MPVFNNIMAGSSAQSSGDLGEEIANSLRFDGSGYLTRNQLSSGDGLISSDRTFTFSTWFKLGHFNNSGAAEHNIFGIHHSSSNENWLISLSSEQFCDRHNEGGSSSFRSYDTNAKFRDPSAWYHLFLTWSSNVGTLRVNNILMDTARGQSSGMDRAFWIGSEANGGSPMTGYLADTYFIQGTAMDAVNDGFIRLNEDGIYVPDTPTISDYGTNGFHLTYDPNGVSGGTGDGAGVGADHSGNENHFTASNFDTNAISSSNLDNDIDQSDTPTAIPVVTLNGVDMSTTTVVDGGNLSYSGSSTWHKARSTQPYPSTGTWYYEYDAQGASGWIGCVQGNKPLNNDSLGSSSQTGYWVYINDSTRNFNGSYTSGGDGMSAGDTIGVTYNADTDTMKWYKNNTLSLTATSVTPDTQSNLLFPLISNYGQNDNTVNFGQYAFRYTPPDSASGCHEFLTNTEPTIKQGSKHFGVLTYQAPGSPSYPITIDGSGGNNGDGELDFDAEPDLVWIKMRNAAQNHTLFDSLRGNTKSLRPDESGGEATRSNFDFATNGFTFSGADAETYQQNDQYVAWCWKAGTSYTPTVTGYTNASATINTDAGFGIYKFTGNNTASSFTHGLDERPQLVIAKVLGADNWAVFGPTATSTALAPTPTFHRFDLNDYVNKSSNALTAVSDTTLSFASYGELAGSNDYIFYCWHSVPGYSKIGSYYGTGNATGKFTYCGFKPRFVMIKCINQDGDWNLYDSQRNPNNPVFEVLKANLADDEADGTDNGGDAPEQEIDFLANGFKCRGNNASINETYHYMYMAFAEHPYGGENVPTATAF